MAPLAKPNLRGAGARQWGYGGAFSIFCGCAFALWFKTNVLEVRKKHYKEFYENWDDQKEFEAMRKAGIFKGFEPS